MNFYHIGKGGEQAVLRKEFELSLKRTVGERMRRGLIKTYKPVMDDASYRIFEKMQDYRHWCERKLPKWLGYGKAK